VAHAAGVSRALVSLVIREQPNVSEKRRRRVLDAIAELGYRPNAMARSLASRRTRVVGVVLDDLRNPFFADLAAGIEELAAEAGYQLLFASGGRDPARESNAVDALLEYRVDGIILASPRLAAADIIRTSAEVAMVVTGRAVRGAEASFVVTNERSGVEQALDHLVGLGHSQVALVGAGQWTGGLQRRLCYTRGMKRRGLEQHIQLIHGDATEEAGRRAAHELLEAETLPTAIFAGNDLMAVGLLGALNQAGVGVPDEISIVGYDNISLADFAHMSLTTVDQPRLEIGRAALELLLERIGGSDARTTRRIEPTLVVRSTTGPPRASGAAADARGAEKRASMAPAATSVAA
jgi:DNA-binding LacI/PurR family transcriptional regulator